MLVTTFGAVTAALAAAPPQAGAANWAPVNSTDFPDPSVFFDAASGTYYAFATQNTTFAGPTINVQEATSSDGIHWLASSADALPALGSWAKKGETWAPSVGYNGSEYVMYYTATEAAGSGDQCIGLATSTTARGPYTDSSSTPVVCQDGQAVSPTQDNGNYGGSIDPSIFTDSITHDSFLIWKNDGNHIGMGTSIWSEPLTASLVPPAGNPSPPVDLLDSNAGWQSGIVEGPEMVETQTPSGGANPPTPTYYLFYSGSNVGSSSYGIGWAHCPSGPAAGCTNQSTAGPWFTTSPGVSGPGGPSVYQLQPSGGLVMALSGWEGNTIGYLSCGVRPMYLASLTFSNGTNGNPNALTPEVPAASPAVGPTCPQPPEPPPGYWQVASDGGIFTFGGAHFYGSTGGMHLNQPVVGMAATPDGNGYWLVASDGGIFAYGDAGFYGSTGNIRLNQPIVKMMSTLDGRGYWLVASDGGIFAFGDARFYGSAAQYGLSAPITAGALSFLGGGYWLVDANGQVYSFGNATYEGAPPFAPGGYRITGMAGTANSNGYWLASANGYVAHYGDAWDYGSMYGQPLNGPIVGITATRDGGGYWLQGSDGGIFTFGDAGFYGSMGGRTLNAPIVGIASI